MGIRHQPIIALRDSLCVKQGIQLVCVAPNFSVLFQLIFTTINTFETRVEKVLFVGTMKAVTFN